ncbi:MAG: PspA/IM30 family protein [Chloracidobacterium sp.]|nr:PspA/IM30 family protein [Chloracidobacterium sp.]
MGLWARITRVFRASTGAALDKIENPELVLQQTIRDMRDRVPELNNSVAQVMATERLLLKQKENLSTQVVDLDSKIKASVKMGRDDIATAYIGQLQQAQMDLGTHRRSGRARRRSVKTGSESPRQLRLEYEKALCRGDATYKCRQAGKASGTARADNGYV